MDYYVVAVYLVTSVVVLLSCLMPCLATQKIQRQIREELKLEEP